MTRVGQQYESNNFFGIGILNNVDGLNIGTLWRSAFIMGASFIFTIDKKYKPESSDVTRAWTKIPLYHYQTIDDLKSHLPYSTKLIAVEINAESIPLAQFEHPNRAIYLLGNEQSGLSKKVLSECHSIVSLPGNFSLNVAVAGSILLYDRLSKLPTVLPA